MGIDEDNNGAGDSIPDEVYHSIFTHAQLGFGIHKIVTDHSGKPVDYIFIDVNSGFEDLTGLKKDNVIGRRVTEVLPGIEKSRFIEIYGHVALTGEKIRFEMYSDVLQRFYDIDAFSPVKGVFVTIFTDTTERKKTEEELRASEQMLSDILENFPGIVFWKDRLSTFLGCNKTFCERAGYSDPSEIIGKTDLDMPWADTEGRWYQECDREVMRTGIPKQHIIETLLQENGEITWYDTNKVPLYDKSGSIIGVLGTANDITERKRIESDLAAAREDLEVRVQERTLELIQIQNSFQKANEKLNLLSSITRHDILNQINSLILILDLIKQKKLSSDIREKFTYIEQITSVIQHQIDFTRMYQDIGVHAPVWQRVSSLVKCRDSLCLPVPIFSDPLLESLEIYGDPLLQKVFFTLVENGIRHGDHVTRISYSVRFDTDACILIYEDDGIGIPFSEKEIIFDHGFGRNSGLGLFLAREILSITDMTIRETGSAGSGARFEIQIPKGKHRIIQKNRSLPATDSTLQSPL